jgi:hypothetical protein
MCFDCLSDAEAGRFCTDDVVERYLGISERFRTCDRPIAVAPDVPSGGHFRKPVGVMQRCYDRASFGNVRRQPVSTLQLFNLIEIDIEGGHEDVLVASARREPGTIRDQSLISFEIEPHR